MDQHHEDADGEAALARRAVARGQARFNTKPIAISGVSGINDEAVFGRPTTLVGTCSTCHDSPNGDSHSIVAPLDLGLTDASRRTADMSLYTLRNKTTGEIKCVTDLGRMAVDGKWSHISRFKGPMLRKLAPRAQSRSSARSNTYRFPLPPLNTDRGVIYADQLDDPGRPCGAHQA